MNRLISQGQATLSTWTCARVTHFIRSSVLPELLELPS
jgi:hypothetical protein